MESSALFYLAFVLLYYFYCRYRWTRILFLNLTYNLYSSCSISWTCERLNKHTSKFSLLSSTLPLLFIEYNTLSLSTQKKDSSEKWKLWNIYLMSLSFSSANSIDFALPFPWPTTVEQLLSLGFNRTTIFIAVFVQLTQMAADNLHYSSAARPSRSKYGKNALRSNGKSVFSIEVSPHSAKRNPFFHRFIFNGAHVVNSFKKSNFE